MFSYLKVKNFKSFRSLNVNFQSKSKKPKKMVFIYGENGSGKSNLIYAFMFLKQTLETMSVQRMLQELLIEKEDEPILSDQYIEFYLNKRQLNHLVKAAKCIGSNDFMSLEYGFDIEGKEGFYSIVFNEHNRVISEKLYFLIDDRSGYFFDINEGKISLSPSIFKDAEYKEELLSLIDKFWGKHTLLAILMNEAREKNITFITKKVSKQLFKILNFFKNFSVQCKFGNKGEMGYTSSSHPILMKLVHGKIKRSEYNILKITEKILKIFFTGIYSDVKDVFYDIKTNETEIKYELYFEKLIGEKLIKINFDLESTGTQKLMEILPLIIKSTIRNEVVLIDEIDSGIHDTLISEIFNELSDYISGQIICTTHNTTLMEYLNKNMIYFLNVDQNGNKELLSLNDYEDRTQNNHNVRTRYLKGMYNAIPNIGYIDFDEIKENLLKINK